MLIAATAVAGAALVAHLDAPNATCERPVAPEAGQEEAERGQTRPSRRRPRPGTRARAVGTGGVAGVGRVVLGVAGAVVEERLDATQAGDVVDASVGGTQALVVAHPGRRKGAGRPAGQTAAALAFRTDDGIVRFHADGRAGPG